MEHTHLITKINKIKNLGLVFPNYTWDAGLPPFKRYNLIYGLNGSGKTTMTRFFDAIEKGAYETVYRLYGLTEGEIKIVEAK
ncbi:MAG: AAA family ATPase [Candidatus Paceibacterota bacterium]